MLGTNADTGKALEGIDHLRQSVRDILTTPIGSRVLRREYGSRLFQLVDAPTNASLRMDLIAATIDALTEWEPRIYVESVEITMSTPGQIEIAMTGKYLPDGQVITLSGITV